MCPGEIPAEIAGGCCSAAIARPGKTDLASGPGLAVVEGARGAGVGAGRLGQRAEVGAAVGLLEARLTSGPAVSVGGARRVLVDPDVGRGAVRQGERSRR